MEKRKKALYFFTDIVVSQRDHYINGHRVNVELALPLINDSLYEQDIVVPNETWMEKVQRKLQFAIPDQVGIAEDMRCFSHKKLRTSRYISFTTFSFV